MSSYDKTFSITKFGGINQSGDGYNTDLMYAYAGKNFNTKLGGLAPYSKPVSLDMTSDTQLPYENSFARTLAFLTKRWTIGASGIIPADSYSNGYCVIVNDGKLYYKQMEYNSFAECEWHEILNEGESFAFSSNKFDTLTYEINYAPPVKFNNDICAEIYEGTKKYFTFNIEDFKYYEISAKSATSAEYKRDDGTVVAVDNTTSVREAYDAPVDVLLITNATDGMYCVYAPLDTDELLCVEVVVNPSTDLENDVLRHEIKFGCIERYAERIFGAGIDTDPDKIMYCTPYDPFNWEANTNIGMVEDGAGDIQQPNWDGDKFIALKSFSSTLLCIKRHAIWRITGTTPSEFSFKKTYGEGSVADSTVITKGYYVYFLSDGGIRQFDGTGTSYLKYGWMNMLDNYVVDTDRSLTFAESFEDNYILRFGVNDEWSEEQKGNFIIYNTTEGTFNVVDAEDITSIKTYKETLYGLHITKNYQGKDSIELVKLFEYGDLHDVEWESSWIDLGAKNVDKSGFVVYMLLDAGYDDEGKPLYSDTPIEAEVAIVSEKKEKIKHVTFYPSKPKKININGHGRLFKLKMKIPANEYNIHWNMKAGIQIYVEFDYD